MPLNVIILSDVSVPQFGCSIKTVSREADTVFSDLEGSPIPFLRFELTRFSHPCAIHFAKQHRSRHCRIRLCYHRR
jgi:hypothetical protein